MSVWADEAIATAEVRLAEMLAEASPSGQIAKLLEWRTWASRKWPEHRDYFYACVSIAQTFGGSVIRVMNIDNSQHIVGDGNNQVGGSAQTCDLHTAVTSAGELSTDAQKALQTARALTEQTITEPSARVRMVEAVKKAEELAKQGKRSSSSDRSAVLEDIRNIAQATGSTASGVYYAVKAMLELAG